MSRPTKTYVQTQPLFSELNYVLVQVSAVSAMSGEHVWLWVHGPSLKPTGCPWRRYVCSLGKAHEWFWYCKDQDLCICDHETLFIDWNGKIQERRTE